MFGSSGGGWGQNNQQQQQPNTGGGLFGGGGGGGFGQQNTNTGFGQNTGGFGQPAQPQNTGGGLFGGGTTQPTSTFGSGGGFGQQNTQATSSFGARPGFGASTTSFGASNTGGGLFGSANNTGTSTFGSTANNNTGGGLFGARTGTTTNTFGSGSTSNLFGRPAGTSTFGAAPTNQANNQVFPYSAGPFPPPPTTGTSNPTYQPTWQQEPPPASGTASSNPAAHFFHVISAMEPYKGGSFEELRLMDYQQNRKDPGVAGANPQAATNTFGQPQQQQSTFGAGATNTFGGGSTFGAKPAGSMFGGGTTGTGTGGFGTSTTGGFGATNTGGGLFGSTNSNPAPQTSSPFGATSNTGGGMFGQTNTNTNTGTGSSLFGNTNPFGANNTQQQQTQQPASTGFTFGAPKPATTGFGATSTGGFGSTGTTSTFGQTGATGSTAFGGFGQNNQQQQQQPAAGTTGGLFGGGGFGATNTQPAQNSGGLFGQNNQQTQPASGGLFGNNAAKPGGLFGQPAAPTAAPSTGFSFGNNNNTAQPAAGTTGSIFGNTGTTNTGTTGGLFGQQPAQQPAAGTSLFGGANTGSSLFNKPAAPATGGGLFGSTTTQPAAQSGGLFGSNNNSTGTSLFGNNNTQQNQQKPSLFGGFGGNTTQPAQQPTSSLFGGLNNSSNTGGGLFGSTAQQPAQQGQSLFGGGFGQQSTNQPAQPTLTASIDQNPYGNSPLFNQYSGAKLDLSGSLIKKPALPPLTSSSFRVTPSKNQVNKLRGFSSPLTSSQTSRAASPLSTLGTPNRGSGIGSPQDRYRGLSDAALSPHAFVARPSIKKLTVHPKSSSSNSEDKLESVLGKSALRSSQSASPAPQLNGSSGPPDTPQQTASPSRVFNPPRSEAGSVNTPVRRSAPLDRSTINTGDRPLKKGDYWCRPRLEKLKQMPQSELRAISDFVVGRKGYGEVTFLEPVDLTGIDLNLILGDIVTFGDADIAVYPPGCSVTKETPGHGINQAAQVQLENCFSKDKATKQPIKDPKDARHVKFLKRIKKIDRQEFVSYSEDGTWVFRVEHFSRYGLPPDSDDESEEDDGPEERDEDSARSGSYSEEGSDDEFMPPTKGLHDVESGSDGSKDDEEDEEAESSLSSEGSDRTSLVSDELPNEPKGWNVPAAHQLNSAGWLKMKEMQSGFFGSPRGVIQPKEEKQEMSNLKRQLRGKGFEFAEEEDVMLDDRAVKRTSFGEKTEGPMEDEEVEVEPKVERRARKYARVALKDSSVTGREGKRADAGLALGRSFRCSWGPNGELVHAGMICKPAADFTPEDRAIVVIEDVGLLADDKQVESTRAKRLIDLHLARTRVELFDGVPMAQLDSSIRFVDFARLFENGDRSHEANIWRLGVALFDEIDLKLPAGSEDDLRIRIAEIRRKLALSKWLENAVAPLVDHDLLSANNSPEKVFTLLSGNQLERAVQAAIDGNDMRLSTLVAQIGGSDMFREEVMRQLEDWKKFKVNPLISDGYRRLYALFAGIMDVSPGDPTRGIDHCKDVVISAGLDWKRAFGLRLWFGNPFDHTITDVLQTYASDLQAAHAPATPLPAYLEKPGQLKKQWTMGTEPTDVLYGMIKLYSDVTVSLEEVLRARDCSPSPLDARLQWHLYLLLSHALKERDFADRDEGFSSVADGISTSYAAQLEEGGDWTMAAFVLLHLETVEGRYNAIKALLHRHPNPTASEEEFLLDTLSIPETWLHEARAAELASEDDAYGEYRALIRAGLYERAHGVLKDKLAIEAVVRGDHALLRKLCEMLSPFEPEGWEYGGQLFLDYLELNEDLPEALRSLLSGPDADPGLRLRVEHLQKSLGRVTQLVPALFPNKDDPRQAAALGDMLSTLAGLDADVNGQAPRGGVVGGMVVGDRLGLLQQVAWQRFEREVGQLVQPQIA